MLPVVELVLGFMLVMISKKIEAGGGSSILRTLVLFGICGMVILYGYFRDPYAPLYCYAFTMPISNAFGTAFALTLGGAVLVYLQRDVSRWKWRFSMPGLAYCLWSLAGLLWAEEIFVGLDSYIANALGPMLMAFLLSGLTDQMFRRKFMLMVTAACVIGSLVSLCNWSRGIGEMGSGGRFYSMIPPDPFSAWELFGIFAATAWLTAHDTARWLRWALIAILPLLILGLGLCGFRAAILATILGFLMVGLCQKRIFRALGVLFLGGLPVLGASTLIPNLFGTLMSRFSTIATDRGSDRLDIWEGAIHIFKEHSLIGVGLDNFKAAISAYYGQEMMPHSIYIGALTELGIIGFVLLLIWIGVLLRKAWTTSERIWVFPLLTAYVFQAAFLHEFYYPCFWLAIGLVESFPLLKARAMSPATGPRRRVVVAS
jgi:hypothetical protein